MRHRVGALANWRRMAENWTSVQSFAHASRCHCGRSPPGLWLHTHAPSGTLSAAMGVVCATVFLRSRSAFLSRWTWLSDAPSHYQHSHMAFSALSTTAEKALMVQEVVGTWVRTCMRALGVSSRRKGRSVTEDTGGSGRLFSRCWMRVMAAPRHASTKCAMWPYISLICPRDTKGQMA